MNNLLLQPQIGEAVKVKNKLYLVLDVKQNRLFCREFQFTKQGQFKDYQDYNFPLSLCNPTNKRDKKIINEQRIKASMQQQSYSAIRSNHLQNLVC